MLTEKFICKTEQNFLCEENSRMELSPCSSSSGKRQSWDEKGVGGLLVMILFRVERFLRVFGLFAF